MYAIRSYYGTVIEGKVRNLTSYGAFVEIEEGIDGLLHVSDISWTKKVNHPSEILKKGDVVRTVVLNVDQDKKRVALGLKQLDEDPWRTDIPKRYLVGSEVEGKITKLTNFGAFVELEENLEGFRITSYNVCYTKLLRSATSPEPRTSRPRRCGRGCGRS